MFSISVAVMSRKRFELYRKVVFTIRLHSKIKIKFFRRPKDILINYKVTTNEHVKGFKVTKALQICQSTAIKCVANG
jgi:hypothetical protein